tara:strand:- start:1991 stop:3868 length:1878 start_codon:yes stop_codon:yes gene_type:complete
MGFVTKVDLSYNRQIKDRVRTTATLSGATQFGLPFSALTAGPDYSTEVITSSASTLISTFVGTSASTTYSWPLSQMALGELVLSALTPSNSGITQNTDGVFSAQTSTVIDGNTVVLTYTGVEFDLTVNEMVELAPNSYSGNTTTSILYNLSAGTLDYTGRTIWSDNPEISRTDRLIVGRDPVIGYVLTCVNSEGMVGWFPSSGGTSGVTNTYTSGGTFSGGNIIFTNTTGGTYSVTGITSIDNTNLMVATGDTLQSFADSIDHAVLKTRGTGVATSYVSTVSIGGTTFAQPEVDGEINSDEGYFHVHYTGATGITVTNLNAASTYIYIDNTGTLQQQTNIPTRQDWSRKMFTMHIGVDTSTELIINFRYLNNPIGNYTNSIRDLYSYLIAQGIPLKKNQIVTGRAGDLGFDVGAGTLMEFGGTGDINDANIKSFDAVVNTSYRLLSRTAVVSTETNLVKYWDNGGTITALGSTTFVGHRLYRFSSGNFAMQYGQGNYANLNLAKAGVLLEDYVVNPRLEDATFLGWWFVESTATNTGGTTLTAFVEYTIGVQGGSSSSLAGCLLKGNNLSDLLDASAARTNLGLTNFTPLSASATGTTGEIKWDADFIYICVSTNTWKRSAITTW